MGVLRGGFSGIASCSSSGRRAPSSVVGGADWVFLPTLPPSMPCNILLLPEKCGLVESQVISTKHSNKAFLKKQAVHQEQVRRTCVLSELRPSSCAWKGDQRFHRPPPPSAAAVDTASGGAIYSSPRVPSLRPGKSVKRSSWSVIKFQSIVES